MHSAAQKYLQTQVTTTSQGDLLIMLYDGAITFLGQAKVKIKDRDYAAKGVLISKALDIINELASSLNKEKGGSLAENLGNLYFLCNSKLLMANLKLDCALIDEVIGILSGLRDAYSQIIHQGAQSPAQAVTAPTSINRASPAMFARPGGASSGVAQQAYAVARATAAPANPVDIAPGGSKPQAVPASAGTSPAAVPQQALNIPAQPAAAAPSPAQDPGEAMRRRLMCAYGPSR